MWELIVVLVMYVYLRAEGSFRMNIAVGVTLPHEARSDPEVEALLDRYRRQVLGLCLVMLAVQIVVGWLPVSDGVDFLLSALWVDLLVLLSYLAYIRCNRALRALKARRGWEPTGEQAAGATVDLTAAAQLAEPARRLSALGFLVSLAVSAGPTVWELAAGRQDRALLMLIGPGLVLLAGLLNRLTFVRRSDLVDDNPDRTMALTRMRRRYRQGRFLALYWYLALAWVGLEVMRYHILAGVAAILLFSLVAFLVAVATQVRLYRLQARLTADSGQGYYADRDADWKWGTFYYNPNDRSRLVNSRTGGGTAFNLARPLGKAALGLAVAVLIGLPLAGVWMAVEERAPVELELTDGILAARQGGSAYVVASEDMDAVQLVEEFPADLLRLDGVESERVCRGNYHSQAMGGSLILCLDPRTPPWLLVTTKQGERYLLGGPEVTGEIAQRLGMEAPGETAPAGR